MSELWSVTSALCTGIMFGAIFFGGLWLTVRKGILSGNAVFWFLGSMLLRTGIVLLGFYYFFGSDWKKILAGLVGFVMTRLIVTHLTRVTKNQNLVVRQTHHAP